MAATEPKAGIATERPSRRFEFPTAITTLTIVTVLVWTAALFIPSGTFTHGADGAPIPGTYTQVPSPLTFWEKVQQLVLAPVNGFYGLKNSDGFVDTETVGRMFGSVGVVMFIFAIGAFISVSFATRSLEVAVSGLGNRLREKGWLLIAAVMVLFSLLGSTMGFSVETFGFYALLIPLMTALGYDRLTTSAMIILGALIGVMGSTVNPFMVGVAAGEAGVSIGDGIALRMLLWVLLTGEAIWWVIRYSRKVARDRSASLVGFGPYDDEFESGTAAAPEGPLTGTQKWVLGITILTFLVMIFSVIPWSSIFGAVTGPADDLLTHETTAAPYWFELGWWFPQLAMLFFLASVLVGFVARMGEKRTVRLIVAGAADMLSPAIVIMLAAGVSVIMTNTQTLDTILRSMENLVSGASAAGFGIMGIVINLPLAFLIPSSSGHAVLAMPLLAPLADFAGVSRTLAITSFQLGHGLIIISSPTSVVVVGGLAIAKVGYDKYIRFLWPLLLILFAISAVVVGVAAALE